jgi:hypothetical protein
VARDRIVHQLPSTAGIQDPQVRGYLDALTNAWTLRNGDIGDGEQRFITAKEFDNLARQSITGFFGGAGGGPSIGNPPGGTVGQILEGIAQSVFASQLFRDLGESIKRISAPWDTIDYIDGLVRGALKDIKIVQNGITRIDSILDGEITTVDGINVRVGDAESQIVQINTVSATSTSANALSLFQLMGRVGNVEASITQINLISVTSTSATASALFKLRATMGQAIRSYWQAEPPAGTSYTVGDQWFDTDNGSLAYYWNGAAWVVGSLQVYAYSDAGIVNERTARVTKDTALASEINSIWASVGGVTANIEDGSLVNANAARVAFAQRWTTVQSAVFNFNTNTNLVAAVDQRLTTTINHINNKFSAAYTLRVEVGPSGRTTIGGFGILGVYDGALGTTFVDFGVRADRFWITNPNDGGGDVNPFTVYTQSGPWGGPGVFINAALIGNATIGSAKFETVLQSANYFSGSTNPASVGPRGWMINCVTGSAEFNNIIIRGRASVARLAVTGAETGILSVENNSTATYVHNENRHVIVTVWSQNGSATIHDMTLNSFTVRVDFNTEETSTVYFRYF